MLYDSDLGSCGERRTQHLRVIGEVIGSSFDPNNWYKRQGSIYIGIRSNSKKIRTEIIANSRCVSRSKSSVANIAQLCFCPFRIACSFTFHRQKRVLHQNTRKFWRITIKEELNTRCKNISKVHRGRSEEKIAKIPQGIK
eukprot:Seg4272.2 transcript_id=Seg4272.2/GoldUCD/mRNA.D3Y31 product="hypothetical protein" protein_id=Seg4272.2/GoldUCD/D3Y31